MICREYLIHLEIQVFNTYCGFFLSDNEFIRSFIHNFQFWCKFNKFIFFFGKKLWKSLEKRMNNLVDIPISILSKMIL